MWITWHKGATPQANDSATFCSAVAPTVASRQGRCVINADVRVAVNYSMPRPLLYVHQFSLYSTLRRLLNHT